MVCKRAAVKHVGGSTVLNFTTDFSLNTNNTNPFFIHSLISVISILYAWSCVFLILFIYIFSFIINNDFVKMTNLWLILFLNFVADSFLLFMMLFSQRNSVVFQEHTRNTHQYIYTEITWHFNYTQAKPTELTMTSDQNRLLQNLFRGFTAEAEHLHSYNFSWVLFENNNANYIDFSYFFFFSTLKHY